MQIGAISELTPFNNAAINSLSSDNYNEIILEISKKSNDDIYTSFQMDFGQYSKSICEHLAFLSNQIDQSNNNIADVKNTYLPLSGGTITGCISIEPTDNGYKIENNGAILYIDTSKISDKTTAIQTAGGNNSANTIIIGDFIKIDNGILRCTKDIDGCALTAKWS